MSDLGQSTIGPVTIDVDALIGSHACIVANPGGGKSGLIRRLLETTHGQVQHIVLDIEDEFYTLRERFDYVIAGGDGGDCPATVDNAEGLALAALTHGFSMIVQLNDLGADAPAFVGRFLTAMIGAPRDLWHPCLVVLDEAHRFVPSDGSTAATAGVKALTAQGRKRGFTAVLASQRISKINADVRGDVNNWILGRVGQTLDRNLIADQLGFTVKEGRENLRAIEPRSFWGFGPAIAPEPLLFRVDDAVTTVVKAGQAKVTTPPPPEALSGILAGLAVAKIEPTCVDAQVSVNDLHSSRASEFPNSDVQGNQLSDLSEKLAAAQARIEELESEQCLDSATGHRQLDNLMNIIGRAHRELATAFEHELEFDVEASLADVSPEQLREGVERFARDAQKPEIVKEQRPMFICSPSNEAEKTDMPAATKKLIDALARFYPRPMPLEHIAKVAGVSMKSSQWRMNHRAFHDCQYVGLAENGYWQITEVGVAALGLRPALNGAADLLQFWVGALPPATGRMLKVLANHQCWMTRDDIAALAGISLTSSAANSGLKELRDLHLASRDSRGRHIVSEVFL